MHLHKSGSEVLQSMGAETLSIYVSLILLTVIEGVSNTSNDHCNGESNTTHIFEKFTSRWLVTYWEEKGYFTQEDICDINLHWLSFGPPDDISFIVFAVVYIIIMFVALSGNFLVLFLFLRCKSLRSPGNTLIANLAVSDFLMNAKAPVFIYNCFHMGPVLGDAACRLYGFLGGLTGVVSIVTLSAISFDRYYVIKYPLKRAYSKVRVKICLVVIWTYGLTFSLIPVLNLGLGKYTYEGYLTSCGFNYLSEDRKEKNFIFSFFVAAWVVPLTLITFCYVHLFRVVRSRAVSSNKGARDSCRHVKEEDSRKQELKLAFVVLGSVCLWLFSWTPYAIVALLGISGQKHLISPLISMIPATVCKTASCINPFVYALSHPKFKSELRNLICKSVAKSMEHSKVWSTHSPKNKSFGSFKQDADVEEEMVEVEVRIPPFPRQASFESGESPMFKDKTYSRKPSAVEMFCLPPNFSNNSSTLRKMSRKWSAKEKRNEETTY